MRMQEEINQIYLDKGYSKDLEVERKQTYNNLNSAARVKSYQKSLGQNENISCENFQSPKRNSRLNEKQLMRTPSTQQKNFAIDVQAQKQEKRNGIRNQKIQRLYNAFSLLDVQNDSPLKIRQNLAKIAFELQESQENILRQYKVFRKNMNVHVSRSQQGQFEPQQRKIRLEKMITEFLKKKGYFSSRQFVYNAQQTIKKQYKKKQIQQCFQKLVQNKVVCFKKEEKSDDYVYDIFNTYKQNGNSLLFFSNYNYITNGILVISVGLLCGEKGISYVVIPRCGHEKRHIVEILLEMYFKQYGPTEKYVVVTAFQDVYNSNSVIDDDINLRDLYAVLQPRGSSLFILQHRKEYMNIALRILLMYKTHQRKAEAQFIDYTLLRLDFAKRNFTQQAFLHFITKKPSRTSISTQTSKVQMKIQQMSK